jgi:hypothetical protein
VLGERTDGLMRNPATGSASTLERWLALRRGEGVHTIDIK